MPKPDDEGMRAMLDGFGLDMPLDVEANSLSVGQRQRVCIIRTLLHEPEVLLLDEPTSALDPQSRVLVERYTESLNEKGVTILLVSHSDYTPSGAYRHIRVENGLVSEDTGKGAAA